jgi:serine/threonine protein kinase
MTASVNGSDPKDVLPPRLGRYEVRAKIGDGGMASVYLARRTDGAGADRVVAVKVIKDEFSKNPEFVTMFLDEARIVSHLSHPNLVRVIEQGTEGHRLFIAMELLFGRSLWEVWEACRARGVRLRYDVVAWIGARVADGLHHAHHSKDARGEDLALVHRDVNPSNIFVTYDGHVKVIDFGLAKARNRASKTAAGVVKGKLAYLSPEQVAGQPIDGRSDVFALGTTLWEVTTDLRLFRVKDDSETLKRVYAANVPDPATLIEGYPPALWEVLRRALARDPAARYASAAELARALDTLPRMGSQRVDAAYVGNMMRELFVREREQDAAWIAEASATERPPPASTMHPPQLTLPPPMETSVLSGPFVIPPSRLPSAVGVWTEGAPPDGMFAPPAVPSRRSEGLPAPPLGVEPTRPAAPALPLAPRPPAPHVASVPPPPPLNRAAPASTEIDTPRGRRTTVTAIVAMLLLLALTAVAVVAMIRAR